MELCYYTNESKKEEIKMGICSKCRRRRSCGMSSNYKSSCDEYNNSLEKSSNDDVLDALTTLGIAGACSDLFESDYSSSSYDSGSDFSSGGGDFGGGGASGDY